MAAVTSCYAIIMPTLTIVKNSVTMSVVTNPIIPNTGTYVIPSSMVLKALEIIYGLNQLVKNCPVLPDLTHFV